MRPSRPSVTTGRISSVNKSMRESRGKSMQNFTFFKSMSKTHKSSKNDGKKNKHRSPYWVLFKRVIIASSFVFLLAVLAASIVVAVWVADVSKSLTNIDPNKPFLEVANYGDNYVYSSDGIELRRITGSDISRDFIKIDDVPDHVRAAFIAAEDKTFYENKGVDPTGIVRAAFSTITDRGKQGASTITQQVVKINLASTKEQTERSLNAKLKELILSIQITQKFKKDEILQLYINSISFGSRYVGIRTAAKAYFNKEVKDLTYGEAAFLAGIPNNPARLAPCPDNGTCYAEPGEDVYKNSLTNEEKVLPDGTKVFANIQRENEVLSRMQEIAPKLRDFPGLKLDDDKLKEALAQIETSNNAAIVFNFPKIESKAPHFTSDGGVVASELRVVLKNKYPDKTDKELDLLTTSGGFRIYTTLDYGMQQQGEETVKKATTIGTLGGKNSALISVEPKTGAVKTYVGSVDFNSKDPQVNGQVDIVRSLRSMGSSMKPGVYLAGFVNNNFAPSTIWPDIPLDFGGYKPTDYGGGYANILTMNTSQALISSKNVPAVQGLMAVGIDKYAQFMGKLGYNQKEQDQITKAGLPSVLGSAGISMLNHAQAYQVYANMGTKQNLYTIDKVTDRDGNVIFQHQQSAGVKVVDERQTFLLYTILKEYGVIKNGIRKDGYDAAGKTGTYGSTNTTTNEVVFWGYTPNLLTGMWNGNSDNKPIAQKATGEGLTNAVWSGYMRAVLPKYPKDKYVQPGGIVTKSICSDTGYLATGTNPCPRATAQFVDGQFPKEDKNHVRLEVSDCNGTVKLASKADILAGLSKTMDFIKYESNTGNANIQRQIDAYASKKNSVAPTETCNDPRTGDGSLYTKISSPPANTSFNTGDVVTISVDTLAGNPTTTFYLDSTLIATVNGTSTSYTIPSSTTGGAHNLRVTVTDSDGKTGQAVLVININSSVPSSTPAPTTITITNPTNGSNVGRGVINVSAQINDPSNAITTIQFFGRKVSDNSCGLSVTKSKSGNNASANWNLVNPANCSAGQYEVYAVASNGGSITVSSPKVLFNL